MRSSRKLKKSAKCNSGNDVIITEDIESTESYAGVGNHNIVKPNSKSESFINYINHSNTKVHKSHVEGEKKSQQLQNITLIPSNDFSNNPVSVNAKETKGNNNAIRKKKLHASQAKTNNSSQNNDNLFPPLRPKSHTSDLEVITEGKPTINNQIEKLENRKLKLTLDERRNRMKEVLNRSRKNWSNFKSEIDFVKCVESSFSPPDLHTEMIKNENLLNDILNDIVTEEKENMNENIPSFEIVEQAESNVNEMSEAKPSEENCNQCELQFTSVIKPMIKEYASIKMSEDMAMNFKQTLFNSTCRSWGSEWYRQNIEFYSVDSDLPFGMIQKNQGPNNIMAVIQAEFLVEALFNNESNTSWINNVKRNRMQILSKALSNIIARCRKSESDQFQLCLLDTNLKGRSLGVVKTDGITECMLFYQIQKKEDLTKFILHNINQFTDVGSPGLILVVASCLITYKIAKDHRVINSERLISPLGFSDENLMNLLIHGKLNSHYFNDNLEIVDSSTGKSTVLYGIQNRSSVGFLTTEIHCEYCQEIGTFLKTPKYPIWISKWKSDKYAVLFCHNKTLTSDWKTEIRFQIYLYSPLFKCRKLVSMIIDSRLTQIEKRKLEEEENERKLKLEQKFNNITENSLKKMSESARKFILEDSSIDDYINDVNEHSSSHDDSHFLEQIIHIKWPNAIVTMDDDQLNVFNMFKN